MPITVTCQSCGQAMSAEEAWIGQNINCIKCSAQVLVQATPPAAQPAPAAPGAPAQSAAAAQPAAQPAPAAPGAPAQSAAAAQPAPAAPGAPAQPAAPAISPKAKGKPRRTFVADWAQDMAEQWAEDHQDDIASDRKPSRSMLFAGGALTMLVGSYVIAVTALALFAHTIAVSVFGAESSTASLVAGGVLSFIGLLTVASGALSFAAKQGFVGASIGLSLVWAMLAMIAMLYGSRGKPTLDFWFWMLGVILLCCFAAICSAFGRKQARNYQLWVARQSQIAKEAGTNTGQS